MKKILFILLCCFYFTGWGQEVTGEIFEKKDSLSIYGTITDKQGEPVPFANVSLLQEGNQILGTTTDFDGHYRIKIVAPGVYDLKISYVGHKTNKINGITLLENTEVNTVISKNIIICFPIIHYYHPPVFRKDETTSGRTFSREEIRRMPF